MGDLAVLTWPSPSYTDQVLHVASNALDVRERHLPEIEQRWDVVSGLSGQSEQDAMMMQTFAAGFLLTFVFIYLILAWVFSSWTWPVAIMTAIPFGLTGAIFGDGVHTGIHTSIYPGRKLWPASSTLPGGIVDQDVH